MDWIKEYKNAIARGPKEWKYKKIASICKELNQEYGFKKFAELGAGPLFLKRYIDKDLDFTYFDKFCFDDTVQPFDIDHKNDFKKLKDFDVIVMLGTLEYSSNIYETIKELRKLDKFIILYITLPIFSLRLNNIFGKKWRKDMDVKWFIKKRSFLKLLKENKFSIKINQMITRSFRSLISSTALVLIPDYE
tara:strand:- start:157 stop:729 length:573 start_codon:yes stop_codon:yes gene_type:complete